MVSANVKANHLAKFMLFQDTNGVNIRWIEPNDIYVVIFLISQKKIEKSYLKEKKRKESSGHY